MSHSGRASPNLILRHPILIGFLVGLGVWLALGAVGVAYSASQVRPTGPLGVRLWSGAESHRPRQFVILVQEDGVDALVRVSDARWGGSAYDARTHTLELADRYGVASDEMANKPDDSFLRLNVELNVGSSEMGAGLISASRQDIGGGTTRQTITLFDDMGNEWSYVYTRAGQTVTLEEAWANYDAIAGMFAVMYAVLFVVLAVVPAAMAWIMVSGVLFALRAIASGRRAGGAADGTA